MTPAPGHYLLLLNDTLKAYIVRLDVARQRRLREKLEYLEAGLWDTGVRVKKLRGSAKVVFEARVSRGERLLFTLGRHRDAVAVFVWGLVSHDDIGSGAERIIPSNAPFLSFQELEHEEKQDLNLEELPETSFTQENVEEKVPEDYGPQRWLVFDEKEWGRLLASPDPASFEGFLHLTREQEDLLASPPPVLLSGTAGSGKTTLSVYYLLRGGRRADGRRTDGRRAGARPNGSSLFLTCNPLLKGLAERIYAGLVDRRVADADASPPRFALFREIALEAAGGPGAGFRPEAEVGLREFAAILHDHRDRGRLDPELAWEEIRSIIKGATVPLDPRRCAVLVDRFTAGAASVAERRELLEYLAELRNLGVGRASEAAVVRRSLFRDWDAMLAGVAATDGQGTGPAGVSAALGIVADLVSKAPGDFSRPLLALEDYLRLGAKRAPNFRYDRRALHAMAEFYQERLERSGRWDEIDLARAALRAREKEPARGAWDLVVCDEVQDLADVQIALVFHLAADPRSVVLTGDPRQILNPTSFRWEEVKYRFRERGLPVPEVRRLSLNFRCVGPIVRLANALLDLKASLVGLTDTEMKEEWKFGGRPPVIVSGMAEEPLLRLLAKRGAGQVILTRGPAEAARLRSALGTELVFTIAEAKGLEFDTVLLWRFAADPGAEALWRAIASGEPPAEEHLPHVRYELALLYVAVTRTRSTLLVWDGPEPAPVWKAPGIDPLVFRTQELERAADLWKTVSLPEEWEAQGDYLFERGSHAAARECYRNAGAEAKMERAGAYMLEHDGDYAGAAPLFEHAGEHSRAAACWERAGLWTEAEKAWRAAGEVMKARVCAARGAEARGDLAAAAQAWDDLGDAPRAVALWEKAGAHDKLAQAALAAGEHARAAGHFEKARMSREAAGAWEHAGFPERAGDVWLRVGDHAEAARLYRRAHADEKLLRCLRQLGEHHQAGLILEKRGDVEKAVEAFAAAAAGSEETRQALAAEIPDAPAGRRTALKAAVRLAALGREAEAAPLFARAGALEPAARRYERLGDYEGMSRCYEEAGRWLDAAHALDRAGTGEKNPDRAVAIQSLLYRHLEDAREAGRDEREVQALLREAEKLRAQGNLPAALARYRLLGDAEGVVQVCRTLGSHENALEWLLDSGKTVEAEAYAREGGFTVTPAFFDSIVTRYGHIETDTDAGWRARHSLFVFLLCEVAKGLAPEAAHAKVTELFDDQFGQHVFSDWVPDEGLDLLLSSRASSVIINLVEIETGHLRDPKPRAARFLDRLSAEAARTGDPGLLACDSCAKDRRRLGAPGDAFENAAAVLPLTLETCSLLGRSRKRHVEAVNLLMEHDWVDEAEYFCRINRSYTLAARWAEKRGDFPQAVKYYRDAKDLEGAMRCARATGDPRDVARVHEWRGEYAEALAGWRTLGRSADVARILKRHPELGG